MTLAYKPDWEETQARYRAWWAHEYFGRCALAVVAPLDRPSARPAPPAATTVAEQWYDLDAISDRLDYHLSRTYFGGEALPVWYPGYPGIAAIPTILGCPFRLDMHTGWHDPVLTDPEGFDVRALHIDKAHWAYQYHHAVLQRGAREATGKSLPSIGAFYHGGDTLAALRGTEQLLLDCLERPAAVREAELYLMDMWCEFYDESYAVIREAAQGSLCWIGAWAPGKTYAVSNDFSYNISPRTFQELFLPAIERQLQFLDYSIYHVDGEGAFAHVDALCALPRLHALQILPGAGKPSQLHYLALLKKVQAAGKNLHLSLAAAEVRPALEQLSARGLYLSTWCRTETEARELLGAAERWSADRG